MPYVRDSFWRGRTFGSLEAMQADALDWAVEVAGTRRHPSLDGAAPAAVFAAVEQSALKPLPRNRFVVATWSTGKVCADIHVKVGPALYSAPWRLIGQQVQARSTATTVQLVHEGVVVATHLRAERGRRTNNDHFPPEKIAFYQRTPTWCRATAKTVGPACTQVIAELMVDNALSRLRSAQGILGLRTTHGADRLEAACAAALAAGNPSYRTIKGILVTGADTEHLQVAAAQQRAAQTASVPAFLRGPDTLFGPDPAEVTTASAAASPVSAVVLHLPTTSAAPDTPAPSSADVEVAW